MTKQQLHNCVESVLKFVPFVLETDCEDDVWNASVTLDNAFGIKVRIVFDLTEVNRPHVYFAFNPDRFYESELIESVSGHLEDIAEKINDAIYDKFDEIFKEKYDL